MANLFVGNLTYTTDDDSLKGFFESVAPVKSAHVITDRDTNRSKGFGFVEFEDEANNDVAIDKLNDKELDGRAISISVARPREERPRGGNGGGHNGGGNSFRQRSW